MTLPSHDLLPSSALEQLLGELLNIRADMMALEASSGRLIESVEPVHAASVRNLLHYLALRRHDLRQLQVSLASVGLSSLGRAEPNVFANVEAVIHILGRLLNQPLPAPPPNPMLTLAEGKALLRHNTDSLLGLVPEKRVVRIMVTMPSEAADNYELVRDLLRSGMNVMRINCAHDRPEAWAGMTANLRRAEQELGRSCQVLMDLAGPKLRTGLLEPGPQVLKWRPQRNELGQILAPARIWLTPQEQPQAPPEAADASLPLPREWLAHLRLGDRIQFTDARGSKRRLKIRAVVAGNVWATCGRTSYVVAGTLLGHQARSGSKKKPTRLGRVGTLPAREIPLTLQRGDVLLLTKSPTPGRPGLREEGMLLGPASIPCTLPEVFADVRSGEPIWLDDGKIGGVIRAVREDALEMEITHARPGGEKLYSDKGINLPESSLQLPALTATDLEHLPFVVEHADLLGYSFVQRAEDIEVLVAHLDRLGGKHLGIVLKIETRRAFANLPNLLPAVMRSPRVGVMIARGDLAVECGYERLAEVQEEILWICEAAHLPVIWATQVLETLAKTGLPSRAEISDAAMGERAECVMLNKGPHIIQAVQVLDNILQRMQAHQSKKRSMLRPLRLAGQVSV